MMCTPSFNCGRHKAMTPQSMDFTPDNLPKTKEGREALLRQLDAASPVEKLDFALGLLNGIHAILDKALPGYVPEYTAEELAKLSTDEKIALGNRNIAELEKISRNHKEMVRVERLDRACAPADVQATVQAAIERAAGKGTST